jgi:hypothetical protein
VSANRGLVWTALAGVLCFSIAGAAAQGPQRMGPGRHADGEAPRRMVPGEQSAEASSADSAEAGDRRGGRMSPEERRQLRRDVHQAGRDLYPERMRGGRRGDLRGQ